MDEKDQKVEIIFKPIWNDTEALRRLTDFKQGVIDIGSSYYIDKIKNKSDLKKQN